MKKLVKSVLMLSIASLAILSSCKKTDETTVADVSIDVTASPSSPMAGSIVTLTVKCTGNSDNNLKSISVSRTGGDLADKVVLSKTLSGTSSTQTIVDTLGSGTFIYTVALTGGAKTNSPATKTITVVTREAYGTLQTLPVAVDLSGQTQDSSQNYFMRLTSPFTPFDRGRKTFADNKANIDVCFYYGNSNKATLASPDDQTMHTVYTYIDWTGAKKTEFAKTTLTATNFDDIETSNSDSAIIEMAKTTTWVAYVNQLKKDDVLIYRTAAGKKGLIKVQNLVGQDAAGATLSIKAISQN